MCYQHLFEILFFGVFREYSTKITDMNQVKVYKDYEYHEIYAIVNIVFMASYTNIAFDVTLPAC